MMITIIIVVKLFDAGYNQCVVNAPEPASIEGFEP